VKSDFSDIFLEERHNNSTLHYAEGSQVGKLARLHDKNMVV
jgi:hypothetical protein